MAKKTDDVGPGKAFFSEWHKERYVEDLGRELDAAKLRVEELEALGVADDAPELVEAHSRVKAATALVAKFGAKRK